MELYAIKSKDTGELVRNKTIGWHEETILVYISWEQAAFAITNRGTSSTHYPVRLRIEPTESCGWCPDVNELHGVIEDWPNPSLEASEWNLCPMCGRNLNDDKD